MSTINLSKVDAIIEEAGRLMDDLDGKVLDETLAGQQDRASAREERVQRSRDLQQLAHLFELAATLVRNEYWHARGGQDMIHGRKVQ